ARTALPNPRAVAALAGERQLGAAELQPVPQSLDAGRVDSLVIGIRSRRPVEVEGRHELGRVRSVGVLVAERPVHAVAELTDTPDARVLADKAVRDEADGGIRL